MTDPNNLTPEELRQWAFNSIDFEIEQDWGYMLPTMELAPTIYELACDTTCPKRLFFLECLYHLSYQHGHEKMIKDFVEQGLKSELEDVRLWAQRSTKLFEPGGKSREIAENWLYGGFLRQDNTLSEQYTDTDYKGQRIVLPPTE